MCGIGECEREAFVEESATEEVKGEGIDGGWSYMRVDGREKRVGYWLI